jgi:DNA-binding transcriptional ArsR family regulator
MSLEEPDPTPELRALAHPLRLRILSLLTGAPMTAADVARELDITHANASYHLRHLLSAGMVEIDGEETIRGGKAKRYRYDVRGDLARPERPVPEDAGPTNEHRLVYAALAAELRRRAALMRRTRGNYLADAEFWIDPEVWAELRGRIAEAADDLHRAAQPPRTPGTERFSVTVALFEMEA